MARCFVIDPELQTLNSHSFQATERSLQAAQGAGYSPVLLTNRNFARTGQGPIFEQADVYRELEAHAFVFGGIDGSRIPVSPFDTNIDHCCVLDRHATVIVDFLKKEHACEEDIVFCHTLSYATLHALIQFLQSCDVYKRPNIYSLLYCDVETFQGVPIGSVSLIDMLCFARSVGLLGTNLLIHVETKNLQQHYADLGFNFPVFMGPLDVEKAWHDRRGVRDKSQRLKIGVFGDPRGEKGWHRLPSIIRSLIEQNEARFRSDFLFQIQANLSEYHKSRDPSLSQAHTELIRLEQDFPESIHLLGSLNSDEYLGLISSSDVALMPYDEDRYQSRGSGVVYESLLYGLTVVATPGTDLVATFSEYGVIAPSANTDEAFAEALLSLQPKQLGDRVSIAADQFLGTFSLLSFFENLRAAHNLPATVTGSNEAERRVVDYVALAPMVGGVKFVTQAQLSILSGSDLRVRVILAPFFTEVRSFGDDFVSALEFYYRNPEVFRNASIFALAYRPSLELVNASDATYRHCYFTSSVDFSQKHISNLVDVPAALASILNREASETIFFNYLHYIDLVEKVRFSAQPVVCEIQDLFSNQFRLENLQLIEPDDPDHLAWVDEVSLKDRAIEVAAARRCSRVISLTEELSRDLGPLDNLVIAAPGYYGRPQGKALEVPPLEAVRFRFLPRVGSSGDQDFDLLFVGTNHLANVKSLELVLSQVMPRVWDREPAVRLAVVGSIADAFAGYDDDRVLWVGVVDDPLPYYAATKVVLSTVFEGSGLATKTLEAFALGCCVTVNDQALRSYASTVSELMPVPSTYAAVADDVLHLVSTRRNRDERRAAVSKAYNANFGAAEYARRLGVDLVVDPQSYDSAFSHFERSLETRGEEMDDYAAIHGSTLNLSDHVGDQGFVYGWSHHEGSHRWMLGELGIFRFKSDNPVRTITFFAKSIGPLPDGALQNSVRVEVNGQDCGVVDVDQQIGSFSVAVEDVIEAGKVVQLILRPRFSVVPEGDPRKLSILVTGFEVANDQTDEQRTEAELDEAEIEFSENRISEDAGLGEGWSFFEGTHRWMIGKMATAVFEKSGNTAFVELSATTTSELFEQAGGSLSMTVSINSAHVGTFDITPNLTNYRFPVPESMQTNDADPMILTIESSFCGRVDRDMRDLSILFSSIRFAHT